MQYFKLYEMLLEEDTKRKEVFEMKWMSILDVCVAALAVLFGIYQFVFQREQKRIHDTLDAYHALQDEVFNQPRFNELDVDRILGEHQRRMNPEPSPEWQEVTKFLAAIDRFSLGVNSKTYSIYIAGQLSDGYLLKQYMRFGKVIQFKRESGNTSTRFSEFEKLALALSPGKEIKKPWILRFQRGNTY